MIIDLIGCKKYFQTTSTKIMKLKKSIYHSNKIFPLLLGNYSMGMSKNHFDKDFETEKYGSSLVSACNFDISEPTYDIDHLVTFQEVY